MTPDQVSTILYRLDKQDEVLGEIHTQAKATNGRVTALELQVAVDKAVRDETAKTVAQRAAFRAWATPMVAGVGATVGATVLAHFL